MPPAARPTLFIGSSSEGLAVAEHLHAALDNYCDVNVWNQGTFGLSGTGIASLVKAAREHDFAALILTADDMVTKRGDVRPSARDNVLFEAGLFIGTIGLERTFLISRRYEELSLPSDLDGVTRGQYRSRDDGRLGPALTPVALLIRERLAELGPRNPPTPSVGIDLEVDLGSLLDALQMNRRIDRALIEAIHGAGGLPRAIDLAATTDDSVALRNLARVLVEMRQLDAAWAVAEPIVNHAERRKLGSAVLNALVPDPQDEGLLKLLFRIYSSLRDPQRRDLRTLAERRGLDIHWPEVASNP